MAYSLSTSSCPPPHRRLRLRTVVRRCVGGAILLAGASLLTMDLMALVLGAAR